MTVRSAVQEIALEHRRRYGYRRVTAELVVELTTQQLHQVHTKRRPTENSVHFPAAPLLGMRKDLSEHDEETQLC